MDLSRENIYPSDILEAYNCLPYKYWHPDRELTEAYVCQFREAHITTLHSTPLGLLVGFICILTIVLMFAIYKDIHNGQKDYH